MMNVYDLQKRDMVVSLIKQKSIYTPEKIISTEKVANLMINYFDLDKKVYEVMYVIGLDATGNPLGISMVSQGGTDCSLCLPYTIFTRVLLMGVSRFILVHNHPGGSISPSKADSEATKKVLEGAKLLELDFVDHVIIGSNRDFFSFREYGLI